MDYGDLMFSTTTLAGGLGLLAWAVIKLINWRKGTPDEIGIAMIIAAVGLTMLIAGSLGTIELLLPGQGTAEQASN